LNRAPAADNDGVSRPVGRAPDAGAYEYGTGIFVTGARPAGRLNTALRSFRKRNAADLTINLGSTRRPDVRRLRDVEVITLNSRSVTAAQTRWLRQTLARRTDVPRIVVLRHPPYSCGTYAGSASVRAAWAPLFRQYRIRLVLGGEADNYQRFGAGGTTYVVSGDGARSAPVRRCPSTFPRRRASRSSPAFVYLAVDAGGIHGVAVSAAGKAVDRFNLR
jgi:hypothetical protein